MVGKKNVWEMPFEELLEIVDALFPKGDTKVTCYNYSIGRMPYGWVFFSVTNDWKKWSFKKYKETFGAYNTIEACLAAFLEYVIKNKIEPYKLYEP